MAPNEYDFFLLLYLQGYNDKLTLRCSLLAF